LSALAEKHVLEVLFTVAHRDDAAQDCAPRRDGLPSGTIAAVECRLYDPAVARVGIYPFASPARALTMDRLAGSLTKLAAYVARRDPAAAAIDDGRVFVGSAVPHDETSSKSSVVIYAPWTESWGEGGVMVGMSITRLLPLTDGRLLVVGDGFELSDLMLIATPGGLRAAVGRTTS
jgi:hypothetical protein